MIVFVELLTKDIEFLKKDNIVAQNADNLFLIAKKKERGYLPRQLPII